MPPKQKQAKKGPTYKANTLAKDIIPPQIKQPPREAKPLKIPQSFPQPLKNIQTVPALFQDWPSQQVVKSNDFGLHSESKFTDTFHEQIHNYLSKEGTFEWKHMNEIQSQIQSQQEELEYFSQQNASKQEIESFKELENKNQQDKKGAICVIETFMRPENEEQMQIRLKEEAEKAEKAAKEKKKAAKKQEPKEQGPIQVSDVKMNDIISKKYMTKSAIWIGSQLQIIKQRNITDVYNNEAIWKKIYPQQNGVPQITKSGKYWVKLLYMGKYIKIEVDDRIPVNQRMKNLFPYSAKVNEKWTLIITKALIKYLAKAINDDVIGSGLITYALTGMISQNIPVNKFKQWQRLEDLLNNEHYLKKDIIVNCFSADKNRSFKKLTKLKLQKQSIKQGDSDDEFIQKEIETRIINGYSYCIGDYFDNDSFNMVFSQQKSQKQMLLKHEYNQLCKISISNKNREQKLQYRRRKKQLKEKLLIQQKKRLQLISKQPIHYHFLKLLSNLKIQCQYGEKEILLAKKCVVNKLNQPPNYDIPLQKEQNTKSLQSLSVSVIKYKEESQLFPNIHDFTGIHNAIQLLQRKQPGIWIKDLDLLDFFQYLQVIYNPNIFHHKKVESVESKKTNSFTYDENKEILVVEKVQQDEEKQSKVRLLFGYSYQKSPHDTFSPYTIVQKFDFDSFRSTSNVVTLRSDISSKLIELKNQNSVFKLYTMSKGNYNYNISSDSPFKLLSIADYLTEFEGYSKKNITFQYPPIEADTYFPLARLKLKQDGAQGNTVLIKLVNTKDQLAIHLNYRLVAIPKEQSAQTSQQIQGIIKKNNQKLLLAYEYTRFVVESNYEYYLIIEAHAEQNIPDGSIEIMLLSKEQGLSIDQVDQVEPFKFIEKYVPNKYGIICKERIFTNSDNNVTINLKIAEFEEIQGGGGGGKAAKKGGKEQPSSQLVERPFSDKKNIILRILNGDKILFECIGTNQITVSNFKFYNCKSAPAKQYYLEVKFDLRSWPEASIKSQKTDKICWVAQIMAQDSLAFVRDTKQEDRQKQTRKSWEDSQPGRAERAKKARRKFLIEMKKQNGQALTEEEEQILNAPRLTKKQLLEQEKKNEDKKGGKGGKKDDKKGGKKQQEVVVEKAPQRPFPKSQNNFMNQIKQFLQILQNCVIKYEPLEEGEPRIRSQEQIKSIKQGAIMSIENRVGKLIRNVQKRETMKIRQKQKKQSVTIFFSEIKSQFKDSFNNYIQWRNQDSEKDKTRQDKQRLLVDIINQDKPTISQTDLKKNIAQYREINGHNPYLADVAEMVRKNIKIANLTEKINNLMVGWEIDELKNINEQIKNQKIQGIDAEVLKQFQEMLVQAEKNPNIVAQKQAEAKKGKKGGKK